METKKKKRSGGFIRTIIIIVGALVFLRYVYDIDIVGFLIQGRFKELFGKLYELSLSGWQKYGDAAIKVWGLFIDFVKKVIAEFR